MEAPHFGVQGNCHFGQTSTDSLVNFYYKTDPDEAYGRKKIIYPAVDADYTTLSSNIWTNSNVGISAASVKIKLD